MKDCSRDENSPIQTPSTKPDQKPPDEKPPEKYPAEENQPNQELSTEVTVDLETAEEKHHGQEPIEVIARDHEPVEEIQRDEEPAKKMSQPQKEQGQSRILVEQQLEEPKPQETRKKTKFEKPASRRSSVGTQILNAFLAPGTEDTMSPIQIAPRARPRRAVQTRAPLQQKPIALVPKRPKNIRYSFDLGERVAVKSCLKRTLIAPVSKSPAQKAASKLIKRSRNSGNIGATKTPPCSKLKFHKTCSIRVITPRPDYNPNMMELPSGEVNTSLTRERLSTVELQLTPTSQANLDSIRNAEVVQFNADMIFGDNDSFEAHSSTGATSAEAAEKTFVVQTSEKTKTEFNSVDIKKKPSRRKSVMLGSASPLKSPAKIETARFEGNNDELIEPRSAREPRRSVRLKAETIEKPEEVDVILEERETNSKNKRDLVSGEDKIEPEPKRSRRKSGYLKKNEVLAAERTEDINKKYNTPIHSFFTPKSSKNVQEKPKKSEENVQKERKKARRSSAYFGTAHNPKRRVSPIAADEDDIIVIAETSSISSQSIENDKTEYVTDTAIIATTSSASSSQSTNVEISGAKTSAVVHNTLEHTVKQDFSVQELGEMLREKDSSSTSSPAPKLFSLFSPKPKPKSDSSSQEPESSLSVNPIVSKTKESATKSIGVKKLELWEDSHPENYQFMLDVDSNSSVFEETSCIVDQKLFNSRSVDSDILNVFNAESELREMDHKVTGLLIAGESPQKEVLEKLPVPKNSCPTAIYPSEFRYLVEGAEEEETITSWLKKWKRRVRKDIEREMEAKKQKKDGKSKRGRKTRDDDDEDFEFDGHDDELENPLVLIGPTGVGKTALIRALAKHANMRIISMGPETDRSGSEIKRKLEEAIKSHRIDQQPANDRSLLFFKSITEKTCSPQVETKKTSKEYIQSLIVFEHVDVFFDTLDRYGVNNLLEIVNNSAVPIVFTCENDWPRGSGQTELKRRYLEVRMSRNNSNVKKYVKNLIYSCRDVSIDDSTISQLSTSVNNDLQGLIRQAYFYSLAPTKPFTLTSRHFVSSGFEHDWERPPGSSAKDHERIEDLLEEYSEVLPDGAVYILHPSIEKFWNGDRRKLALEQSRHSESVQNAYDALNGRYSRKDLAQDVLPLLIPIDRVERQKIKRSRRHLHRFNNHSHIPTDGDLLRNAVSRWSFDQY